MTQLPSLRDNPNTKREYETIYILRPNTGNDEVATYNKKFREIIEERGGKVMKVDNWGKRRLAYEVSKERRGIYLYWQYLATPDVITEFERNMRMMDGVMRFLTTRIDEDIDPAARPGADEEIFEAAANTAADEEDMYTGQRQPDGDETAETVEAAEGTDAAPQAEAEDTDTVPVEATPAETAE